MNFALYLTPHNVESITIIVMVFGLIIGWLTERSVQAATHNAINAVLLIPSVMLAVYPVYKPALTLVPPHSLAAAGTVMALYLMGDISTYVRKINVAIIERPLKEKLGLAGALVFALVRFLVDITMYLGWFTRQVELTSLPAIQQVRLQEIRDQPWAHALRVLWVLLLVALAATAAALLISPLFVTKLP